MGVLTALGEILSPQYLLMMIAGTIGGIMIGAMPGLTSVMGVPWGCSGMAPVEET